MSGFLRSLAAVATLASLLAVATYPAGALAGERKPLKITLAFTGDVGGYLEPCG